MNKLKILEQARGHILEVSSIMRSIETYRAWAEGTTPRYREITSFNSTLINKVEDGAIELAVLESEMDHALCGLPEAVAAAHAVIDSVEEHIDRAILRMYYIEGMTWARVGELVGYSESQCRRRRNAVLDCESPTEE